MRVGIPYGRGTLDVTVPDSCLSAVLRTRMIPPLADPVNAVATALSHPVGTRPLAELARGRRRACIVTSDITRPVPNRLILPPVLDQLQAAGMADTDVTILIGTGAHRAATDAEIEEMFGRDIPRRCRIVSHDMRDADACAFLGPTPSGGEAWVNRIYTEADLRITVSLVEPHPMAGYSGGRKAICPGIVGGKTMAQFHGYAFVGSERSGGGMLDGNPLHHEAEAVAALAGCDLSINVTFDRDRHLTGIFAGDIRQAFAAAVRVVEQANVELVPRPVDIVITSGAGYPQDVNIYQSLKALLSAKTILKPGGTMILVAECSHGVGGQEFAELIAACADEEDFHRRHSRPEEFVLEQWAPQLVFKSKRNAEILCVTAGISDAELARLHLAGSPSVEAALDRAFARLGPQATVAVIPEGFYVLPRLAPPSV